MTEVILLTRQECSLCEQAKGVLGRIRDDVDVVVREVALESEEGRQLSQRATAPFPPVVFIDNEPFSYGRLSERKLRKALG